MSTVPDDQDDVSVELSGTTCQRLVQDFVGCTAANEALAQMFLQQNDWNLERAVGSFFDETGGTVGRGDAVEASVSSISPSLNTSGSSGSDVQSIKEKDRTPAICGKKLRRHSDAVITLDDNSDGESASSSKILKKDRGEVIFITYNIDGICEKNRELRTRAVCKIIQDTKADIIFLQEVVPATAKIIEEQLQNSYNIISGKGYKGFPSEYFTLSLLRKETVKLNSHKVIDYGLSVMTRNMLTANVTINGITINLLNTHLESTKDFKCHRMRQFEECYYQFVKKCSGEEPVIVAGDLNMRDKELADAGGLPPDMIDAWVATGRKKECEFTWDMARNDNLDANFGRFKPRCRFDRILVRDSKPSRMIPAEFNLIGIERLKPHVCFPSDHWGILCVFSTFERSKGDH